MITESDKSPTKMAAAVSSKPIDWVDIRRRWQRGESAYAISNSLGGTPPHGSGSPAERRPRIGQAVRWG